jgi:hypothetical protein
VTKQAGIVALLFLALFSAPLLASAQTCGLAMPVRTTMDCSADCCAKMKSCVLPQQNPAQATATAKAAQPSVVMTAPVFDELLAPVPVQPFRPARFVAAQGPAHSPSPLALSCTLLI